MKALDFILDVLVGGLILFCILALCVAFPPLALLLAAAIVAEAISSR